MDEVYIIRNKWTEENINDLKIAYLRGVPLKIIAAQLNRSVSAINKVLNRHHLRPHSRIRRLPSLPRPTAQEVLQKRKLGAQSRKRMIRDVTFPCPGCRKRMIREIIFPCPEFRQWVRFEHVLFWLKAQKIFVTKSDSDVYYEANGFPHNKQQILLMANLLREKNQLPIFFVKGVTNS